MNLARDIIQPITQSNLLRKCLDFITMFYLIFFGGAIPQHMEFSDQGSDQSHSCDLHHSCGNSGSLTHCARLGIKPASQCGRDAADAAALQQELHCSLF